MKKILTKTKSSNMGILKRRDGQYADSMRESVEILLKAHFPGAEPWKRFRRHGNHQKVVEALPWLSAAKVKAAIATFSSNKASGPDQISVEMMKRMGPHMLRLLSQFYSASMTLGYVPRVWKTGKTVFINKSNKDDYSEPKAWRGITLLPVPLKVLERAIQWKLEEHFARRPLNDRQYAFRKGRSCDHALSRVVNKLEKAKEQGQFALYVGLDISGAYNHLSPKALVEAMRRRGIDEPIVRWVEQFLSERRIQAEVNGQTAEVKVTEGVGQGAVTSTILWDVAYDELLNEMDGDAVDLSCYADDGSWVLTGCDLGTMYSIMQKAIDKAVVWAEGMNLTFCNKKTQVMLVTNKRKFKPRKLYLYGKELTDTDSISLLGVCVDRGLRYTQHIDNRVKKAKRLLMTAKPALARTWGPRPELTRWLLTGVVTPILTYASHIWFKALDNQATLQKLNAVQRLGLLLVAPVRRSTPTAGLEVLYDVPPIDLKVVERAMLNAVRIRPLMRNLGNWMPRTKTQGHLRSLDLLTAGMPVPADCGTGTLLEQNFSVEISDGLPKEAEVMVFTDGSSGPEGAGSGGCVFMDNLHVLTVSERVHKTTAFMTELNAIHSTCNATNVMGRTVRVMSDSQAAIQALSQGSTRNPWVKSASDALNRLGKYNFVTLAWVSGHKNHAGNELADAAARRGASSARWTTRLPPATTGEAKAFARANLALKWKHKFNADTRFRQTKLFIQEPDSLIWNQLRKLNRANVGRIVRFVTGHAYLLRMEAVIGGVEDTADITCRLCQGESETAEHVISHCPALAAKRLEIFGSYEGVDVSEVQKLAELLSGPDVIALEEEVRLFPPFS